jgi:hypothetical protein
MLDIAILQPLAFVYRISSLTAGATRLSDERCSPSAINTGGRKPLRER